MNKKTLGTILITVLIVTTLVSSWLWWRAWSAPLVDVFFRPGFSVHGIGVGTPVRVQGVVVGQVSSIGLSSDSEARLRPQVNLSLNPEVLDNRGFAERLRGKHLQEEVAQGLRVHLVVVSPASGLLQIELFWAKNDPLPAGLAENEIPATGQTMQRAMERLVKELNRATQRDLEKIAQDLEKDLDHYFPKSDPAFASAYSAKLVAMSESLVTATNPENFGPKLARITDACAALRSDAETMNKDFSPENLIMLQAHLADATAALDSFAASLEGSQTKINASAEEITALFQLISRGARDWKEKTEAFGREPRP
ncbi:MAG: MCE family protein [Opitutales bacterium]|nr:MCE family protein [Opitutales bacterium]